jgi:hypothetical protein
MDNDIGLQRAIMASIRDSRGAPPPRAPPPPRPQPTQPRRAASDIAPTVPGQRGSASGAPAGVGRRNQLARDGIKPAVPARPAREPRPSTSTAGTEGADDADAADTRAPPPPKPPVPSRYTTASSAAAPAGGRRSNAGAATGGPRRSPPPGQDAPVGVDPKFVAMIESDILQTSPGVAWEDVASLGDAKRLLNEAVALPLLLPEFFTGIRQPWKGVLLFGPPGTGKTMLAKAVATSSKTTFFATSASTLVSRYHGESEKLVKALFAVARQRAPSTIFFDEADALVSVRGEGAEHEASRRLKSELLQQIDGVSVTGDQRVMVLCTTNKPWDIDEAMRRRLEKRIYIPLPDEASRLELFKIHTASMRLGHDCGDLSTLAGEASVGRSGADVQVACREAAMMPMRRLIDGKSPTEILEMKQRGELDPSAMTVTLADFHAALARVPPTVGEAELRRYQAWNADFGSS